MNRKMRAKLANQTAKKRRTRDTLKCDTCGVELELVGVVTDGQTDVVLLAPVQGQEPRTLH